MNLHDLMPIIEVAFYHQRNDSRYPSNPRMTITVGSYLSRSLITLLLLWLIVSALTVILEAIPFLGVIGIFTNFLIVLVSGVMVYGLWRYPDLAANGMILSALILILASIGVFIVILQADIHTMRVEFFWSFMMMIPASIIYLLFSFAGRDYIYLTKYTSIYPDTISQQDDEFADNEKDSELIP